MEKDQDSTGKGGWLGKAFRKKPTPKKQKAISPNLLRDSETKWELPKHEDQPTTTESAARPKVNLLRAGVEELPVKKRKRPWWMKLFTPGRKKRRRIRKTSEPLFIKPIPEDLPRERFKMNRLLMVSINSTILFLLAFVIVYLIYQMSVIFVASQFGISGVLYYYTVFWPIGNSSPLWFPYYRIILITGAGPIVSLILGIIAYRALVPYIKKPAAKLFMLWIALHALNMFFGAFVAGVASNDGFGYVALWLYMNIVFRILFSLIFLFLMGVFGYFSVQYFLETSPSQVYLRSEKKTSFLIAQVLLPSILGALILFLIRMPINPPYQILLLLTIFAATIAAVFNRKAKPDKIKSFPKHHGRRLEFVYLLVTALLLVGFRLGLEQGLHFIIKISVNISVFGAMP